MQNRADNLTTIAAPATGPGGAISLIRLSGPRAIAITESISRNRWPTRKDIPYISAP